MARTTRSKQKRAADEDNTDTEAKPQAKKKKTEGNRPTALAKRGRRSGVEPSVEQENEAEGSAEDGEFDESQGAENHMKGFQHQ
ncbi:hypothetical protein L211DRAFT_837881 [Terfezia boudieri ATCC MYA-4762]|uniref:Uncharacterized protein n=1 Tax=Terfezia boudieri ATCC MYA-4762 TaxID=1051890 RepID=A0A3N4LM49_9PEZI|nr:hypothetical protein L211DRAFT_837881 [Terfezia boudieri ATCC MYA-4762]